MGAFDIRRRPQSPWATAGLAALLPVASLAADGDPASLARTLVARHLDVDLAETRVRESSARVFGDASLDCPVPGMAYPQVLTPGHIVIVEAEGRRFDVRVTGTAARLCTPREPPTVPLTARRQPRTPSTADGAAAGIERARRDLAFVLRVEPEEVQVLESHRRGPREGLAACGDAPAAAGETVVSLGVLGRVYQYVVTGPGSARPCPGAATR